MKTTHFFPLLFLMVFALSLKAFACEQENEEVEKVFVIVEQMPEFPDGMVALQRFIRDNKRFPVIAGDVPSGHVTLQFIVRKTGEITDIRVVRGVDPLLDREAIRIVESMPNWIPGKQRGEKVNVRFTLPVTLINPNENFRPHTAPASQPPQETETMIMYFQDESGTTYSFYARFNEQEEKKLQPPNDIVFIIVEQMPEFPDGRDALNRFLREKIFYHYPHGIITWYAPICGRVVLQFTVLKTGEITDIEVIRGFHGWADEVAVLIVESMPNWIPGKQRGEKVNVRFTLPIAFRLHCW